MSIPNNILSVKIGNELYAFDGDKVEQILRVPAITKMPLTQNGLRGISSISGKVVTMIDMGIILGHTKIDTSKVDARVLTIKCDGSDYGILVDEVLGMESVDEENYEESQKENTKISGLYKRSNKIYQIIDECVAVNSLTLLSYKPLEVDKFGQTGDNNLSEQSNSSHDGKSDRFLFLTLGNEEFAISLDIAREIIFLPEHITPISEAGYGVMGMITLRGELIVAIDLKKVIGVPEKSNLTDEDKKEYRLLILSYKGKSLAILVDGISEVKDIYSKDMEILPDRFADSKIESVFKSPKSIVSIVSKKYLTEILEEYSIEEEEIKTHDESLETMKQEDNNMSEIAVFQISKEEYSLDIEDVQEIIKYTEVTPIPEAPQFVDGVINLRGVVIPIISLPERLGFDKKIDSKSKILVCTIKGEKIGMLVDDVNEIMFIEDKYISQSQSSDAVFSEIITLDGGKRIILKLKISNIVDDDTINSIKISQEK
jgi:purine-binding chemotaxis protein CheW